MKDRWALCALGAWLMGSVIMFVVATKNFRLVDELLRASENASFRTLVEHSGSAATRDLLRYLSSELNREYFLLWNVTQMVLGVLVLWLLARQPSYRYSRRILGVSVVVVAAMLVWLTPTIISVGRSLDFVPRDPPPPALADFWILHVVYTLLDVGKSILLGLVTFWVARGAEPRRGSLPAELGAH